MKPFFCTFLLCFAVVAQAEEPVSLATLQLPGIVECRPAPDNGSEPAHDTEAHYGTGVVVDLYVAVPSVTSHRKPTADSAAVLDLPIGTRVFGICSHGDWLYLYEVERYGGVAWVRFDQVTAEEPRTKALRDAFLTLPETAVQARRRLASQWAALASLDIAAWSALVASLEAGGEKDADQAALASAREQLATLKSDRVARPEGEPQAIFVVRGSVMTPLAALQGAELVRFGAGQQLPDSPENAVREKRFADQYIVPRRAYYRYNDGAPSGVLRVLQGKSPSGCSMMDAGVATNAAGVGSEWLGGVATNFLLAGSRAREIDPSREARAAMRDHAQAIFLQHGLSRGQFGQVASDKTGLHDVHIIRDSAREIEVVVATYSGKTGSPESQGDNAVKAYALTLVAEHSGDDYKLVYQDFDETDPEGVASGDLYETHADLNQNGSEDLIFSRSRERPPLGPGDFSSHSTWYYYVLGRKDGKWQELVRSDPYGC